MVVQIIPVLSQIESPAKKGTFPAKNYQFHVLHSARKDIQENSYSQFCIVIPNILWFTFVKSIYRACYVKIMKCLICTMPAMRGDRYCSLDYWYIFPVLSGEVLVHNLTQFCQYYPGACTCTLNGTLYPAVK